MKKEQFLAMSLPSGLKVVCTDLIKFIPEDLGIETNRKLNEVLRGNYTTILHPLSDLTKEITHNGETFVPIVELAKITYPNHEWKLSSSGLYASVGNGYMTFEYDYWYNCFLYANSAQLDQLQCLFQLIEWHFNLMDESEPFIDVNSLEKNPYA